MKKILLASAIALASLSTAAFAEGSGGGTGIGVGTGIAGASSSVNTEGSVGVSTPGGANPCAVGGGVGAPGVGGISLTWNGKSCVVSHEADDIMQHCAQGYTMGCRHLARNNERIRGTLEAAGVIRDEAPNAMVATAPMKPAANTDKAPTLTPVRFTLDGKRYVLRDASVIELWNNCESITIEGRERPIIKAGCNS